LRTEADTLELRDAVQLAPDAARRAAVAQRIAEGRGPTDALALHGAHAEAARAGARAHDVDAAIEAALLVADLDAARRLAATPTDEGDWVRRGALLCLLGDREAGKRLLTRPRPFEDGYSHPVSTSWVGSAVLACGGSASEAGVTRDTAPLQPLYAVGSTLPIDARAAKAALSEGHDAGDTFALLALVLGEPAGPDELLAVAAPRARWSISDAVQALAPRFFCGRAMCGPVEPTSPWKLWEMNDDPIGFVPVTRVEAAADRLEAASATVLEAGRVPEGEQGHADGWSRPRAALRHLASVLRFVAAVEWSRRGRLDEARRAVGRAAEVEPRVDPYDGAARASVQLLAGDAPGAIALCEQARRDRHDVVEVRVVHALALASLGRLAEAYDVVKPASPADQQADGDLLWVRGALATLLGREADLRAPDPPPHGDRPDYVRDEDPFWAWWRLGTLPDAERRQARRWMFLEDGPPPRLPGRFLPLAVSPALPATIVVVGRSAREADAEVWVDRIVGAPQTAARRMILARAEALRWRGDAAGAARWEERARRLSALIVGDDSAVLATFAGL
jgi:hypothetical protein